MDITHSEYDTEIISRTFRRVCQHGVLLSFIVSVLHGVMFYNLKNEIFLLSFTYAILCIPLFWTMDAQRPFPVFSRGLFTFACLVVGKLTYYSYILGSDFGFHLAIIPLLPVVVIAGRMKVQTKTFIIAFLGSLILYIDWNFISHQTMPASQAFRLTNFAVLLISLVMVELRYFRLVSEQHVVLRQQAFYDTLTGLLNRKSMMEIILSEFSRLERYPAPLSLILCDIDHFKKINDTLGHTVGDLALQHVSDIFKKGLRSSDRLSRWGGEEFLIILPNTNLENAVALGNRLRQQLNQTPLTFIEKSYPVTATIAVTAVLAGESFVDVFSRADKLLYDGKAIGRNRVISENIS